MEPSEPEQCAGELQQPQIVLRVLVVADEKGATLQQPRERSFDHPAPCLVSALARFGFLFTDAPDVRPVVFVFGRFASTGIVVALVQTKVLRRLFRALHDDRRERFCQALGIVDVGRCDHDAERAAVGFDDETFLGAGFSPIRGVTPRFSPPKRAFPRQPSADCHFQSTPPS